MFIKPWLSVSSGAGPEFLHFQQVLGDAAAADPGATLSSEVIDEGQWDRGGNSVEQRHLLGDFRGLLPSGCLLIETELKITY